MGSSYFNELKVEALLPLARELRAFRYNAGGGSPHSPQFPSFAARVRTAPGVDLLARLTAALGVPATTNDSFRFEGLLVTLSQNPKDANLWGVSVRDTVRIGCESPEHWRIVKRLEEALLPLVQAIEPLNREYFLDLFEPDDY